jgi:hypothetical protein
MIVVHMSTMHVGIMHNPGIRMISAAIHVKGAPDQAIVIRNEATVDQAMTTICVIAIVTLMCAMMHMRTWAGDGTETLTQIDTWTLVLVGGATACMTDIRTGAVRRGNGTLRIIGIVVSLIMGLVTRIAEDLTTRVGARKAGKVIGIGGSLIMGLGTRIAVELTIGMDGRELGRIIGIVVALIRGLVIGIADEHTTRGNGTTAGRIVMLGRGGRQNIGMAHTDYRVRMCQSLRRKANEMILSSRSVLLRSG